MITIQIKDGLPVLELQCDSHNKEEKSLFEYINLCIMVRKATERPASDASLMLMGAIEKPRMQ